MIRLPLFIGVIGFAMLVSSNSFANYNNYPGEMIVDKAIHLSNSTEIDIIIQADGISIGGTLMIPSQRKSNSLVIMSSGSGQQDRDETLDGFKIFKGIAEHLASEGIATFRFDDRGVGTSTGDFVNSTLCDLSKDIERIMAFFKSHNRYPFNDFILFGHSLGGIVVANAAVGKKDVKKVILMGAPAVPLIDLILYQVRQEYALTSIDKSFIEAEVSAHNRLMSAIKNGDDLDASLKYFKESVQAVLAQHPTYVTKTAQEIEQMAQDKTNEFEIVYALPSIESFLYHNPSSDYEKLKVPVLGLFGGKDLQVTIDQNKDRMENAFLISQNNYHLMTFNDANHYFQKAITGQRDEYEKLDKSFVDNFLKEISNWIID